MAGPEPSQGPEAAPQRRIWIDGTLVPWERATVHVLSHSHQRGSLVFEYLSVHATPRGPAVFRLDDHLKRLFRSVELVGLPLERDAASLAAAVCETVRANPGANAVKLSAYLPAIEVDVVPVDDRVSVAIAAYDFVRDILARKEKPLGLRPELRLWIEKTVRNRRADLIPPQAKVAANYVAPMMAKWRARRAGYDEVVLVDEQGFLAEGPTTNVFLVDTDGALRTPSAENVLLGITRSSVLEIAKHDALAASEARLRPEALYDAAEVFLTGTSAGVWPVASVDGRPIGDGAPGPVTRRLRERFGQIVSGGDPAFAHWLTPVEGG